MEKKMTKLEAFTAIKELIADKEDLVAVIDNEISLLQSKSEKAKERAAKKKAEGDELRELVKSILTNEFQTADEITEAIGNAEVTKSKVIARLTQLVNNGDAEKQDAKIEGKKGTIKVYKLI